MRDYFGYAMGDFGCNMSFALITNYLMLFYTQYIGLRLSDWAWIIVVGKVWDAINDPLIGGMVDNVRIGKGSKFMPWITIGGSALIIFTTLSFMPIASMGYIFKVIYCLVIYCIWSVAYTMANVPYGALHSCITNDPSKRTNLSTFRSIGAGLAQVLAMLLPLIVYDKDNNLIGSRMVYVALVCSAIGFIGFMLVRLLVTERVVVEAHDKTEKMSCFVRPGHLLHVNDLGKQHYIPVLFPQHSDIGGCQYCLLSAPCCYHAFHRQNDKKNRQEEAGRHIFVDKCCCGCSFMPASHGARGEELAVPLYRCAYASLYEQRCVYNYPLGYGC